MIDVPLVVMATRWFRGVHPGSTPMEPAMRAALLMNVARPAQGFPVAGFDQQPADGATGRVEFDAVMLVLDGRLLADFDTKRVG